MQPPPTSSFRPRLRGRSENPPHSLLLAKFYTRYRRRALLSRYVLKKKKKRILGAPTSHLFSLIWLTSLKFLSRFYQGALSYKVKKKKGRIPSVQGIVIYRYCIFMYGYFGMYMSRYVHYVGIYRDSGSTDYVLFFIPS